MVKNVKKPTPKELRKALHTDDDIHLACVLPAYCVCSRFAFVYFVGAVLCYLVPMVLESCRKKSIWPTEDVLILWATILLTLGTYCVLGDDDTVVPFVCYGVGALFFLFWLMLNLHRYHHTNEWHTWFLIDEKSDD